MNAVIRKSQWFGLALPIAVLLGSATASADIVSYTVTGTLRLASGTDTADLDGATFQATWMYEDLALASGTTTDFIQFFTQADYGPRTGLQAPVNNLVAITNRPNGAPGIGGANDLGSTGSTVNYYPSSANNDRLNLFQFTIADVDGFTVTVPNVNIEFDSQDLFTEAAGVASPLPDFLSSDIASLTISGNVGIGQDFALLDPTLEVPEPAPLVASLGGLVGLVAIQLRRRRATRLTTRRRPPRGRGARGSARPSAADPRARGPSAPAELASVAAQLSAGHSASRRFLQAPLRIAARDAVAVRPGRHVSFTLLRRMENTK